MYKITDMNTTLANNDGNVTLRISGRLDTLTTQGVNDEIERLLKTCGEIDQLTCDVEDVEYISSSGLRIMLGLAKRYTDFRIINASTDVYHVFEMTGFTKIMNIERVMRNVDITGCEIIGRGGVGTVYRIDDETIIKVFREGTTPEEVKKEIFVSKEAFILGMPTAISFDIVRVGNCYGLVYELLNSATLSTIISRDPDNADRYAEMYANLFHTLHNIEIPDTSLMPSALANERNAVEHIAKYFDTEAIDLMMHIVDNIPQSRRLLHCDLQTKNAMMQNGELMLIDMGEMSYGHPLLDLGHARSAMYDFIGNYEATIGLPRELGKKVWLKTLDYYFKDLDAADKAHRCDQIHVVAKLRNFTWLSLSDSFPQEVIRECQEAFKERVLKEKDFVLDVCKTFNDWQV